MPIKLFILGLPGSGKSEVARQINRHISEQYQWITRRFNDYVILDKMSRDELEGKSFKRLEPEGFNVLDIEAFDIALPRLEGRIRDYLSSAKEKEIILIEFARNDYWRALRQFKKSFLQNAYFIYLSAEVGVCKQRIYERIADPKYSEDDYWVSDYIFDTYYHSDDGQALSSVLQYSFEVDKRQILMLDNNCSLEAALKVIRPFIDFIINFASTHDNDAGASPELPDISRSVDGQAFTSQENGFLDSGECLAIC